VVGLELELGRPAALLLAPALAALLAYLHYRGFERGYLKRHALYNPLARVVRARGRAGRRATLAAKLALAAALAAALAKPGLAVEREVVLQGPAEVATFRLARPVAILIIDVSGSMGEAIPGGVKIEVAKDALRKLVERVPPSVDLGLIAFDHAVRAAVPPSQNRTVLLRVLDSLRAEGGTVYGHALDTAISWLKPYLAFNSSALVVFATDGMPSDLEYRRLLAFFREKRVPIHTVYIGKPGEPGEGETRFIARETGGEQYTAETAQQLADAFAELGERVSEMAVRASAPVTVKKLVRERVDLSWLFAAAAAALLALLQAARYRASGVSF
jgi:Ca-activated chloride channel family protein